MATAVGDWFDSDALAFGKWASADRLSCQYSQMPVWLFSLITVYRIDKAMGRPRKPLISRRATLAAALKIIDEEGLDALSIRRLGRALKVQGISLYHHFHSKDDILIGACELALAHVRTPTATDGPWQDWILRNAVSYREALQEHPNLITVLIRRHPLRIGLAELNATAGLLAVQGLRPEAIMPLMEALEVLVLGSANYQSAVDKDDQSESWKANFPLLYHLSRSPAPRERLFEVLARAVISAVVNEFGVGSPAESVGLPTKQTPGSPTPRKRRSTALARSEAKA